MKICRETIVIVYHKSPNVTAKRLQWSAAELPSDNRTTTLFCSIAPFLVGLRRFNQSLSFGKIQELLENYRYDRRLTKDKIAVFTLVKYAKSENTRYGGSVQVGKRTDFLPPSLILKSVG